MLASGYPCFIAYLICASIGKLIAWGSPEFSEHFYQASRAAQVSEFSEHFYQDSREAQVSEVSVTLTVTCLPLTRVRLIRFWATIKYKKLRTTTFRCAIIDACFGMDVYPQLNQDSLNTRCHFRSRCWGWILGGLRFLFGKFPVVLSLIKIRLAVLGTFLSSSRKLVNTGVP